MTDREKAIVMAYTGVCMLQEDEFNIFHKYVEEVIGRPVYTHELGELREKIREASKEDFLKLCKENTKEALKETDVENVKKNVKKYLFGIKE